MTMNQNQATQMNQPKGAQQVQPEEQYVVRLENPVPFPSTTESAMMSSVRLTEMLVKVIRSVLPDLEGGVLYPDARGAIRCTLYFKNKGQGDVIPLAVQTSRNNSKFTGSERIRNYNMAAQQRTLQLSDKAKDILKQFMTYDVKKGVDWNSKVFVTETVNVIYGQQHVLLQVNEIDINKFLKVYYGATDEISKGRTDYMVMPVKPIGQPIGGIAQNWLLTILRLDSKNLQDVFTEIGFISNGGSIPMITGM